MLFIRNIIVAVVLLFPCALSAQTVIINGEKTTRSLRWDDFTGPPDPTTALYAYTYWYVSYKWDAFQFNGDTARWKVKVTLELQKRSWKKPETVTDSLLEHEQGHFNIGWLLAIAFQQRVDQTVFFRQNYEQRAAEIFNEEFEKYRKLELQYDKETKHFHDREQQKKWNLFFKKELEKYR